MVFVMAGGGTGGHVMPLLAVAEELRARGHAAVFVGTRTGLEANIATQHGYEIEWIEIGGLQRVGWRPALATLAQLPSAIVKSRRVLKARRAAAVFSLGGYAAAPVVLAAAWGGVPVVAMEPNAYPGLVTRKLARFVLKTLVNFEQSRSHLPRGRTEVCGLPVRREFFEILWRAPGERFHVLITGGSRGSRTLNRAARESFPLFRDSGLPVTLDVQTGNEERDEVARALVESGLEGHVAAFLDDMPAAYAAADLVVSRAGAGAVSEIAAAGRPSLLVPFPYAADDHQRHNAEAMVRAGAARMLDDAALTGAALFAIVSELRAMPEQLDSMSRAARSLARPGAARRAAGALEEAALQR